MPLDRKLLERASFKSEGGRLQYSRGWFGGKRWAGKGGGNIPPSVRRKWLGRTKESGKNQGGTKISDGGVCYANLKIGTGSTCEKCILTVWEDFQKCNDSRKRNIKGAYSLTPWGASSWDSITWEKRGSQGDSRRYLFAGDLGDQEF